MAADDEDQTTGRQVRCLYLNGCLWDCRNECGDGRYLLSLEERQARLHQRVGQEHGGKANGWH